MSIIPVSQANIRAVLRKKINVSTSVLPYPRVSARSAYLKIGLEEEQLLKIHKIENSTSKRCLLIPPTRSLHIRYQRSAWDQHDARLYPNGALIRGRGVFTRGDAVWQSKEAKIPQSSIITTPFYVEQLWASFSSYIWKWKFNPSPQTFLSHVLRISCSQTCAFHPNKFKLNSLNSLQI